MCQFGLVWSDPISARHIPETTFLSQYQGSKESTYQVTKMIRPNLALLLFRLTITPRVSKDNQSVIELVSGLEGTGQRHDIAKSPPRQKPCCVENGTDGDGTEAVEPIEHAHFRFL
jgi:hypothetical protein